MAGLWRSITNSNGRFYKRDWTLRKRCAAAFVRLGLQFHGESANFGWRKIHSKGSRHD
jgi:hypothetical protein